jgi:pyruvate,water dikinase
VPGEGTALVAEGVTPERWVGRKDVWVARPEEPNLPLEIADQIRDEALKIHKKLGKPVDMEWVFDGRKVYWVQMREITTLQSLNIYSNRISKDMMPGMIQPLIWSINVPLINSVWLNLLEELVGELPLEAEDLAKSFYYRSYFNMGAFGQVFSKLGLPSEGLEMMMGVLPDQSGKPSFKPSFKMLLLFPRMLRFLWDKWHFERKIKRLLPALKRQIAQVQVKPDGDLTVDDLVVTVERLYQDLSPLIYLNVVTPLLLTMYTRILEGQLKKAGIDWEDIDLYRGLVEMDEYNPNLALDNLATQYRALFGEEPTTEISWQALEGSAFENALNAFLARFGHFSDNSNNFTAVPWREDPELVLCMVRDHVQGSIQTRKLDTKLSFEELTMRGLRKLSMRFFFQRVRKFTVFRDQVSFQYVYGYGLFRPYILRIAAWMVDQGWLAESDDIYLLRWPEITLAIHDRHGSDLLKQVQNRRREMDSYREIALPEVIYGEEVPPVFSRDHSRLTGTPTSQGYYQGPVKVIHGSQDFSKVEQGDVIIIPYSDVGWTPLFSRAGAVIAESGGLLSHSSIIAREYQIPAVVSVADCMSLTDGEAVSINGFTGEIVLLSRGT